MKTPQRHPSAFELIVWIASDRNAQATIRIGHSDENRTFRVVEATATINLDDDDDDANDTVESSTTSTGDSKKTIDTARVLRQFFEHLSVVLRRADVLYLTVAQERAAREEQRRADIDARPQLPTDVSDEQVRKRNQCANELFNTELIYVDGLRLIVEHFVRPMREKKLMTEAQMRSV